jgi:aspartate racemase
MKVLIGILGGMGPLATVDLMTRIIEQTPVERDQDHVPVVVWGVPQVPDRQRALCGEGVSPLPAMLEGIAALNRAGATRIAIACNTAHYWFDQLAAASAAPILHIADVTLDALAATDTPAAGPIGLVATRGTLLSGIYQSRLAAAGLECVVNTDEEIARLFEPGCDAIKCGALPEGGKLLEQAAAALFARGAAQVVLGCTEVPVGLAAIRSPLLARCIDPTLALARACVNDWNRAKLVLP